jgi:hypothetical protein
MTPQEKILQIEKLIKSRLARDLTWISNMDEQAPEITLRQMVELLMEVYVHYLRMDAYLESAILKVESNERSSRGNS